MGSETIEGIQANGVHANAKHFAANEQETQRRQMATVVPPRALHELYLLPFEMAVKDAQPASVMCAFPEINGVSSCSSEDLLNTTLRDAWGFGGPAAQISVAVVLMSLVALRAPKLRVDRGCGA